LAFQSLYDILGISQSATAEEIKFAYRRQAMKWHPDRNPNNRRETKERFKEIGAAYKVLSDPQQRAEYDAYLASRQSASFESHKQEEPDFDSGMSGADAAKIFFEQMLDLAFELARRGYDEIKITKMLHALDCPESVAKAVAEMVRKNAGHIGRETQTQGNKHSGAVQLNSVETERWEDVAPYYAAVIGGVHADDRMDEIEYQQRLSKLRIGVIGYFISAILVIFGSIILGVTEKYSIVISIFFGFTGFVGLLVSFAWRASIGKTKFCREKAMRYYLTVFESYHNVRPLPSRFKTSNFFRGLIFCVFFGFAWPMLWTAYRRMPIYALIFVVVESIIFSISIIIEVEEPGVGSIFFRLFWFICAITVFTANRIYFNNARQRINKVLYLPRRQALLQLRKNGGTNSWSWGAYLILFFVLISPAGIYMEEAEEKQAASVATHREAEVASQRADDQDNTHQRDEKFEEAIVQLEARHPELNSEHPRYNQRLVDEAITRMRAYVKQGADSASALKFAVADMEQAGKFSKAYR
jgi:hypothetical protein